MTLQEKSFLVNYLSDRQKEWGFDSAVEERYPLLSENIVQVINEGYIIETNEEYLLTEKGKQMQKEFRAAEKSKRLAMQEKVLDLSMQKDYLGAYNARAAYERSCVIPHGIHCSLGSDGEEIVWTEEQSLPESVKNYIAYIQKIDFSDCNNSECFKNDLRAFLIGLDITGASMNSLLLPSDFEECHGEYLDCPALNKQLEEKNLFPNPPKLRIYYCTKLIVMNCISCHHMESWDGHFLLGVYDCTEPFNFSMAEFEHFSRLSIPEFPKTFRTYYKHKTQNSEKYKQWMGFVGERKLYMPKQK